MVKACAAELRSISASNPTPVLVRLSWVLFCALGGSGVIAYIIAG